VTIVSFHFTFSFETNFTLSSILDFWEKPNVNIKTNMKFYDHSQKALRMLQLQVTYLKNAQTSKSHNTYLHKNISRINQCFILYYLFFQNVSNNSIVYKELEFKAWLLF
jgi:hypothetical protein